MHRRLLLFIAYLFFGKPFYFFSPYTLEEAHQRLTAASERDKRKPSMLRQMWGVMARQHGHFLSTVVDPINLQSYCFRAHRDVSGGVRINAYGEVEQDDLGVRVLGDIRINMFTIVFTICWLILWVVILIILIGSQLRILPLFALLATSISIFSVKRDQDKMYNQIYVILGKSKKKNSANI